MNSTLSDIVDIAVCWFAALTLDLDEATNLDRPLRAWLEKAESWGVDIRINSHEGSAMNNTNGEVLNLYVFIIIKHGTESPLGFTTLEYVFVGWAAHQTDQPACIIKNNAQ